VRIAHDGLYLYVSGRLYDSEPDQIRTNTLYRDAYSGDDILAVVIDSYNDYETALWFVTNPAGARNDQSISNDAEMSGGTPMNRDWNSHWEVATSQNDEGWFAEFRIPFSTLRFQATRGEVTMGLIANRYIPRKNERHVYPAIEPKWGGVGFAKPSQAQRVVLRDIRRSNPVYVTPYGLGGMTQIPVLMGSPDIPSELWRKKYEPTREAGLDLRYSPISNLAVDLTVNTDFAQVEADDQQINLTRFPLFFPEKRQFFQERASTFEFNTGGFSNRLFHSRRIGLDGGQIVRIFGGARAVGRVGSTDFGLLNMQTASHGDRSSENMGVLRLNQQVLNPFSSIGAIMTSRLGSHGEDNFAYGLDASLRLTGDEYLTLKWAQTLDEVIEEGGALDAATVQARWERRKDDGFSYSGEFRRVGADYTPRLGFQLRKDFLFYGGHLQYKRFKDASSSLHSVSFQARVGSYFRIADRSAESRAIAPQVTLEFKGGTRFTIGATSSYEGVTRAFSISDAQVPVGNYWFHEGSVRLTKPRAGQLRGNFSATAGTFYDGTRYGVALNPIWTVSKHLELGGGYEINRLDFPDRDASTTVHLARLKVSLALDTRISFSTFAQYSDASDFTSLNARFRYHVREGTDLWIVWNEGFNTDTANGLSPKLPVSAGRSMMIKYSHALIW
jgi:hypothetical protein